MMGFDIGRVIYRAMVIEVSVLQLCDYVGVGGIETTMAPWVGCNLFFSSSELGPAPLAGGSARPWARTSFIATRLSLACSLRHSERDRKGVKHGGSRR